MDNPLAHLSAQLVETVAQAAQHVVTIHARPRMTASGVVWTPGLAVTADHAVARDHDIHLTLPDGTRVPAELKGRDAATNLAVLHFSGSASAAQRGPVDPAPGSIVIAVGRSADTGPRAAFGIVSTASGPWRTWKGGQMERLLRLDLALNPAAVGGLVVDASGGVVGLATDGLSRLAPIAIPAVTVSRVVAEILASGRVRRAFLGVGLQPVSIPQGPGQILLAIETGGPAESAGLLVGDVILAAQGQPLTEGDTLQRIVESLAPGAALALRIVRAGQTIEQTVTLGERSA